MSDAIVRAVDKLQISFLRISIVTYFVLLLFNGISLQSSYALPLLTENDSPSKRVINGAYIPLRSQLQRLSKSLGCIYIADATVPDGRLFVAVGMKEEAEEKKREMLRLELSQLLTGPKWLYLWKLMSGTVNPSSSKVSPEEKSPSYLLIRRAVTDEDRKGEAVKTGTERLHYLASLIKNWPASYDALLAEDPDLACELDNDSMRASISLLASMPQDTISRALGGETVQMPVSSLSVEQQGFVRNYVGDQSSSITDGQGRTKIGFDSKDVFPNGVLVLKPSLFNAQGADIDAVVYSNINDPDAKMGAYILHHSTMPELEPRRQTAALRREAKSNALLSKITGVSTVTIDKALTLTSGTEPPLSAYLRSFASQTGLTILGRWPDPQTQPADHAGQELARLYNRRLSASIVNRPLAEALDTLCTIYNAHWVLDDGVNVKPTVGVNDSSLDGADPADAADPKKAHIIRFWADPPKSATSTTPKTAQN